MALTAPFTASVILFDPPTEDIFQEPGLHTYSPEFVLEDASSAYKADSRFHSSTYGQKAPRKIPSIHYQKYLEEAGAFLDLPRSTTDALLSISNAVLDDLASVVDGATVLRDYSNGKCSPYLVRALCLVICKTKQAAPFLHSAVTLLAGLDAALKADLGPDRLVKVQILALVHLHNHGSAGVKRPSNYLSQAICEAWSISLHGMAPPKPDQDQCDCLWWTLRNFDRVNTPIARSGPFMIDDTDMLMDVAVMLGDLMITARKPYKASPTEITNGCETFPMLSELVSLGSLDRFHRSHRAYLEIWYHVAAMLTSRYSGSQSIQYNRRLKSAYTILDIFVQTSYDSFCPLPLVPYAISMSTTVIYGSWCDSERGNNETYEDLGLCCNAPEGLGRLWPSARAVAMLATNLRNPMKTESTGQGGHRSSLLHCGTSLALNDASRNSHSANVDIEGTSLPVSEDVPEDFWAGLERACVQFDATFDNLLDYGAFDAFDSAFEEQPHETHTR
ncbi:hypothetical protein BDV12DRAFT_188663 [Aspergillus spectabilis]